MGHGTALQLIADFEGQMRANQASRTQAERAKRADADAADDIFPRPKSQRCDLTGPRAVCCTESQLSMSMRGVSLFWGFIS